MSESIIQTVKVANIEMDCGRVFDGPKPLIIISGLSIKNPLNNIRALEVPYKIFKDEFSLYFFDRKKEAPIGYTLPQMADDLAAVLKEMNLNNVAIMGISQGGMVAEHLAIKYPELVSKLVLCSTSSKAEPLQLKTIGYWAELARQHKANELVDNFVEHCFSPKFLERYRRALMMMYHQVTEAEMDRFAIFAEACAYVDVYDNLDKIKCPVQILAAGSDQVVTTIASKKIFEKLQNSNKAVEFYCYENAGHAVFDELKEYKERIYNFLLQL